jgi:hypothetical protein
LFEHNTTQFWGIFNAVFCGLGFPCGVAAAIYAHIATQQQNAGHLQTAKTCNM